jgi:hypothetical protein
VAVGSGVTVGAGEGFKVGFRSFLLFALTEANHARKISATARVRSTIFGRSYPQLHVLTGRNKKITIKARTFFHLLIASSGNSTFDNDYNWSRALTSDGRFSDDNKNPAKGFYGPLKISGTVGWTDTNNSQTKYEEVGRGGSG